MKGGVEAAVQRVLNASSRLESRQQFGVGGSVPATPPAWVGPPHTHAAAAAAAGVRLADGRVFRGKVVISNATRWDTFEGLVGEQKMPESEKLFRCGHAAGLAGRGGGLKSRSIHVRAQPHGLDGPGSKGGHHVGCACGWSHPVLLPCPPVLAGSGTRRAPVS